ncbi:MAG: recombinase family protein [Anaerolineae bacterium]|nr:recombinase family protein [Anaerolineae bacterium]
MTKRAVLYARVSSDDRGKHGRNLKSQIEMCREYALEQGYQVVAELAEDDRGASGADLDLEKLAQVREMARTGELDVLVVREIDRFARDLAKQLVTEQQLKRVGVTVDYVLGDYPDTPEGRLNKHIKAVIAEYERELIRARMLRGKYNKVKAGSVMVHGLNNAPYGYRVIELENKWRMFEVYEPEAKIIRMIFDWCINGDGKHGPMGLSAIAHKLTDLGIPTRRARLGWASTTVHDILGNTTYYGKWCYGKSSNYYEPVSVDVPPIVDYETWERAQKQRKKNRDSNSCRLKYDYLLRRFVTCGECQAAMTVHARKYKNKTTLYYKCAARAHPQDYVGRNCQSPYFRIDVVDESVWDQIADWMLDENQLNQEIENYQAEKNTESEPYQERLAIVEDLLQRNQEQLERLLDLFLSGDFPRDILTERKQRLEQITQALEQERTSLTATLEAHTLTEK